MITKEIIVDKIEILENGTIQLREKTRFYEDGILISESNTDSRIITPGEDTTKESQEIQSIAGIVHTKEKVDSYKLKKENSESMGPEIIGNEK